MRESLGGSDESWLFDFGVRRFSLIGLDLRREIIILLISGVGSFPDNTVLSDSKITSKKCSYYSGDLCTEVITIFIGRYN